MRGYHAYQSVWTSTAGENFFTAPGKREQKLSYDEIVIKTAYKKTKSVVHWLGTYQSKFQACLIISFHYNFVLSENKIIVKITGKRETEIGLVVPVNFVYITKDKNCSIILEAELEKRKTMFQDLKLVVYKIGVYQQFPFFMKQT